MTETLTNLLKSDAFSGIVLTLGFVILAFYFRLFQKMARWVWGKLSDDFRKWVTAPSKIGELAELVHHVLDKVEEMEKRQLRHGRAVVKLEKTVETMDKKNDTAHQNMLNVVMANQEQQTQTNRNHDDQLSSLRGDVSDLQRKSHDH